MKKRATGKMAYASMFVAISVVICIISSLFPTISLSIVAFAGIVTAVSLILCGFKYSLLVYIATAILALLLVPDKGTAVYYILLFGHYPMTKLLIERIGKRAVSWIIKILLANIIYIAEIIIAAYMLGVYESVGTVMFFVTLILFNVLFILYDICLSRIMVAFVLKHSQNRRFH